MMNLISRSLLFVALGAMGVLAAGSDDSSDAAKSLGISFSGGTGSTLILERDGKRYQVDVAAKTVQEVGYSGGADRSSVPAELRGVSRRRWERCSRRAYARFHQPRFRSAVSATRTSVTPFATARPVAGCRLGLTN